MATVYVIYSESLDRFYIGSCKEFTHRMEEHNNGVYRSSFTVRAKDWQLFLKIDDLSYMQARNIEAHIKRMKSRDYIKRLSSYPAIIDRLKIRYA